MESVLAVRYFLVFAFVSCVLTRRMSKQYLSSCRSSFLAFCFLVPLVFRGSQLLGAELLSPGFRPLPLGVHALVGGKVVIKPGETIESGTIVIRDGLINAVG